MKINQIINENVNYEEISKIPFLKEYGPVLYHGSNRPVASYIPFKFRTAPRDTLPAAHRYINEKLEEKFGLPLRSLLFVALNKGTASIYGEPRIVLPLGNDYRMFYSPKAIDMSVSLHVRSSDISSDFMNSLPRTTHKDDFSPSLQEALQDVDEGNAKYLKHYKGDMEGLSEYVVKYVRTRIKTTSEYKEGDITPEELDMFLIHYKDMIEKDIEILIESLDDYVDSVEEIKNESQLKSVRSSTEVMVYYPDGLTEVPVEYKDALESLREEISK